jgi:MFS transporter, BCD family, chlorophyll transporter
MTQQPLSWFGIFRMGLVQTALGAVVVMTTSTLNRVMVVELALPAMLPGILVALHYALQFLRPRWGYGSDLTGRRTPWIIGGICTLAFGGCLAAVATALMETQLALGVLVGVAAFTLIGIGVGAAGTNLLALLATRVAPERRPAAATIVWLMMIAGFVVTTIIAGNLLDPFSTTRLVAVTSGVSIVAVLIALIGIWGVEGAMAPKSESVSSATPAKDSGGFRAALGQVWDEPQARRFTIFVFLSMLAYSMQDLILEPFAGIVFGMTPGESTKLAGVQHGGVFAGMILVALAGSSGLGFGTLKTWVMAGCIASALALSGLVMAGLAGPGWPLKESVFALGFANGVFAVAAIGSMMDLAGSGRKSREGVRMGMWGAAQAVAFGLGGFFGAAAVDIMRFAGVDPVAAYVTVFAGEAMLFLAAARLAAHAIRPAGQAETGNLESLQQPNAG